MSMNIARVSKSSISGLTAYVAIDGRLFDVNFWRDVYCSTVTEINPAVKAVRDATWDTRHIEGVERHNILTRVMNELVRQSA